MAWCPVCKNEFYDTISICPECGVSLVESLDDIQELLPLVEGAKEEMERVFGFLQYNNIDSAVLDYQEAENDYLISCSPAELEKASRFARIFFQQEDEKKASSVNASSEKTSTAEEIQTEETPVPEEMQEDQEADPEKMLFHGEESGMPLFGAPDENGEIKKTTIYKNYAEKAEDNKSSAYTLLGVGGIGLILDILVMGGVISLPFEDGSRYMITGVMGVMFVLFFIIGIISYKNAKKYRLKALAENDLTEEIRKWCRDNMNAVQIDLELFADRADKIPSEQKYFKRHDKMVRMIGENFLNLEAGYLERFIDDYYTVIFSDKNKDEADQEV